MKRTTNILVLAAAVLIIATGCTRTHIARDFGVANTHNIDKQTVNPTAYKKDVEHTISGEKAQKVIDGYHKEKAAAKDQSLLKTVND